VGAANGLSEVGGLVPLGIEPPKNVTMSGGNASLGAFRLEIALPGGLANSDGSTLKVRIESERVFGAKTEAAPEGYPAAHLDNISMQRVVPAALAPALKYQRGYNKFISPWIVAIADPRASSKWTWAVDVTAAQKAAEGCYSCNRPQSLQDLTENDGVYELYTNGRIVSVRPETAQLTAGYAYLGTADRLAVRVPTVMADTVRPPAVLVAGQNPPVADGMLQETTYLHSGEVETSNVDLVSGGRANWNVTFDRTYRSRTLGGTFLGPNWESTLFRRLRPLPNGAVEYRDGAGEIWRFLPNGGQYTRPKGLFLNLSRTDRGWLLVDQQSRMTAFDELGRLVHETDEFSTSPYALDRGNVIRYLYNAKGQLERVIDPVGRESVLAYRSDGLLETINETWRNRVISYAYANGRLSEVKLPKVSGTIPTIRYGYLGNSGTFADRLELASNLTTITDPGGGNARVTFLYEGVRDKVTGQKWATNESATFGYGAQSATVTDVLKQRRDYILSAQPVDYSTDRAHVTQADEVNARVTNYAFGTLPPANTKTPPRKDATRTFEFKHRAEGTLELATLSGVSTTTFFYKEVGGAPGEIVDHKTTAPAPAPDTVAAGADLGPTITHKYAHDRTFLTSVAVSGDGEARPPVHFTAVHGQALSSTATNDAVKETVAFDEFGRPEAVTTAHATDTNSPGSNAAFDYHSDSGAPHSRGLLKEIDRAGLITKFEYQPQQVKVTDERNVETTTDLDEWLRPKHIFTSSPGLQIDEELHYDLNGRVESTKRKQDELTVTQTFQYDGVGRGDHRNARLPRPRRDAAHRNGQRRSGRRVRVRPGRQPRVRRRQSRLQRDRVRRPWPRARNAPSGRHAHRRPARLVGPSDRGAGAGCRVSRGGGVKVEVHGDGQRRDHHPHAVRRDRTFRAAHVELPQQRTPRCPHAHHRHRRLHRPHLRLRRVDGDAQRHDRGRQRWRGRRRLADHVRRRPDRESSAARRLSRSTGERVRLRRPQPPAHQQRRA
ncbi:MAG TPA: DUF6531 domain-containing protein, partial [Thermoanaerobaculia bacterium]